VTAVYYSLVPDHDGARERQWARSVRSLRRHNRDVPVTLCLYGGARPETLATAERAAITVRPMGSFADALGDIPGHWRDALAGFPTLHKLLSLRGLPGTEAPGRLIYLDCDTYFDGDLADLAGRYSQCDWYAREEYQEPTGLEDIARAEGLVPVRPYNTGVILMDAGLARTLITLLDDFIWYAWRLLLGLCLRQPDLMWDRELTELVLARASAAERRLALPYPGVSAWILEEVATWLTLGRVPGLTHDLLRPPDVIQDGEYTAYPAGFIVAHYYTNNESEFVAHLDGAGG
jgi:hypothetical protein